MGGSVALALLGALGLTFFAIAAGAVLGRAGVVPLAAKKGIGPVLGKVCLPALLFRGMAQTDLTTVPWAFFGANMAAKLVVCALVLLITTRGAVRRKRKSLAKAGVFMLFATRSAVWSLGLPVIEAIWPVDGATVAAPELAFNKRVNALPFVCAPVDNLLIMPLALMLIQAGNLPTGKALGAAELRGTVYRVAKTPAVVMVLLGLLSTLALGHAGLPPSVLACARVAAAPYAFLSLFSIGLSLSAGTQHLSGFDEVRRPTLLLCAKLLLLPTLTAALTMALTHDDELTYFGFLYGSMPTTAAVAIFAGESGVPMQLLTSSILWCTVASGPVLLVTGLLARTTTSSAGASFLDTAAFAGTLNVLALLAFVCCAVCLLWGVVAKPLVRADRLAALLPLHYVSKCQYSRANGLLVAVLCGQLAISGGVCSFFSTFCTEPSDGDAAPIPTSYARSGAVLVAVHATRLGVALLGVSTVQQRLSRRAGSADRMHRCLGAWRGVGRRGAWLAYAVLVALVAAVVGFRMQSDPSAVSGCFVLRLDGGLKALSLAIDFVCSTLLFACVGLLAKFPAAAATAAAVAAGAEAAAADAPGAGLLRGNPALSINPGAAEENAAAQPSDYGERGPAGAEAGDRYGPLLLYEAVLGATIFFGQLLPTSNPAALLLLDASLLQTFSVRAFVLFLLYGPGVRDMAAASRALANRLLGGGKGQAGEAQGEPTDEQAAGVGQRQRLTTRSWLDGGLVQDALLEIA
jgi:predicted permease